jgi:hypothetical protein
MSGSHPYISGPGNIAQMITQLRKSFPQTITSDTVKRLGLAPNNESYVINALQFVSVIDSEGKKTPEASKVFSHHKDDEFAQAFSGLVKKAYSALFDLHGEDAWNLDSEELITFFRQADQTSDAIGKRQSATFKIFAGVCGHAELPATRSGGKSGAKSTKSTTKKTPKKQDKVNPPANTIIQPPVTQTVNRDIGLTVRVEINLPADATKETYDNIFKSIKENLIDAS